MMTNTNKSRFQVRSYVRDEGDAIEATYNTREQAQAHADRIAGKSCHSASVVEVSE